MGGIGTNPQVNDRLSLIMMKTDCEVTRKNYVFWGVSLASGGALTEISGFGSKFRNRIDPQICCGATQSIVDCIFGSIQIRRDLIHRLALDEEIDGIPLIRCQTFRERIVDRTGYTVRDHVGGKSERFGDGAFVGPTPAGREFGR